MAIIAGKGAVAGAGNLSSGDTGGRDFIDLGFPVTDDAPFESFEIAIGADLGVVAAKAKMWRLNGLDYEVVGESQTVSGLTNGVHNITLTTPFDVLTGDFLGVHFTQTGDSVAKADASTGNNVLFKGGDASTPQPSNTFATLANFALSMRAFGTPTGGGDSVNITDIQTANQKVIATGNKLINFSGSYTGTPTALARRIEFGDNNQTISDWTTFDNSPSGDAFSSSDTITASNRPINILVRFTNDTAITGTSNDFYIGDFVPILGESTAQQMGTEGTGTPLTGVLNWDYLTGDLTTSNVGAGQISLANTKATETGHAKFIFNTGLGGTALVQINNPSNFLWNPSNPMASAQYAAIVNAFNAAGDLPCVYFNIGANDAFNSNTDKPTLTAAYAAFVAQLRSDTRADLPIIATLTGRHLGAVDSDQGWTDDLLAQKEAYDADNNIFYTVFYDQPLRDNVHPTDAGYVEDGIRLANAALTEIYNIPKPYKPPQISSVVLTSDTQTTFNLTVPEGSDITPSVSITDVALSVDGFSSEVTITSVSRVNATSFIATHASAVITDYRYNWGANPDITGIVKDNSVRTLPLIQAEGVISAATSTLNLIAAGYPDGTYSAVIYDVATRLLIEEKDITFSSGEATTEIPAPTGTTARTNIDGENPPETGVTCYGVTV